VSRFLCAAALVLATAGASAPLAGQQVVNIPARDEPLQAALTDVFKVGRAEGASWELYGERRRIEVAFDGTGNLHIFDPQNFRVVVVSPTGQFIREIGKQGEGPGEIRSAAGFAVLRDGTVVIADLQARSFLIFDNKGVYQRSILFGSGSMVALGALAADPRGGSLISSGQRMVTMQAQGPRSGGAPTMPTMPSGRTITRYPLNEGATGREIHKAWEPPPAEAQQQTISTGRGTMAFSTGRQRAFEPQLFTGVLADGSLVLSDSSAYALKVVGPDGGVRRVLQRPIRPREVTAAMQRAEKERRLKEMTAGGGPRMQIMMGGPGGAAPAPVPQQQIEQMMRQQIETLQFYPELPVVTGLATGWSGKVWVSRRGNDVDGPGPIDVLDPAAAAPYLGTIAANGPRTPNAFGPNGLAAYIETDQFEVVQIAVRRLPANLR
jgi:hypothetical protein